MALSRVPASMSPFAQMSKNAGKMHMIVTCSSWSLLESLSISQLLLDHSGDSTATKETEVQAAPSSSATFRTMPEAQILKITG